MIPFTFFFSMLANSALYGGSLSCGCTGNSLMGLSLPSNLPPQLRTSRVQLPSLELFLLLTLLRKFFFGQNSWQLVPAGNPAFKSSSLTHGQVGPLSKASFTP